jgi:hypothetical protein
MQYLLTILFAVAVLCVQALLIILKLTGEFTAGWGLILLPCWFVCAVIVIALLIWLFTLFM